MDRRRRRILRGCPHGILIMRNRPRWGGRRGRGVLELSLVLLLLVLMLLWMRWWWWGLLAAARKHLNRRQRRSLSARHASTNTRREDIAWIRHGENTRRRPTR